MKGTYVLIIENHADTEIEVGKIGRIAFKRGFYAYVGSALSGLEQRIARHLRHPGDRKKVHWHIDYLLASSGVEVAEVVFAETNAREECAIASIMSRDGASIAHFGCSDCTCKSHLFFSTRVTALKARVYHCFYEAGLEKVVKGVPQEKESTFI